MTSAQQHLTVSRETERKPWALLVNNSICMYDRALADEGVRSAHLLCTYISDNMWL